MAGVRGGNSHTAKLTDEQAALVRRNVLKARRMSEKHSTAAYAKKFGVSQSAIRRAVSGESFSNVK